MVTRGYVRNWWRKRYGYVPQLRRAYSYARRPTAVSRANLRRAYRPRFANTVITTNRQLPTRTVSGYSAQRGNPYGLEYKAYGASIERASILANQYDSALFNGITQGVGSHQRIGREVTMKKITVNFNLYNLRGSEFAPLASKVLMPNTVRVGIFVDNQPAGADDSNQTTWAKGDDIFDSGGISGYPYISRFRTLQYTERFKILKSKIITLSGDQDLTYDATGNVQTAVRGQNYQKFIQLNCNLNNAKACYAGSTAVLNTGVAVYAFVISGNDVASTGALSGPNLRWSARARITFVDS